ncbi:hypothetical protein C9374_010695 [Naegleria lovaniensis]|uniref:Uncharacterized protein n=1 Tax=Naegleria lovaniensis TaxID=51637 RepID=A0AA88GDA2_NAELO|nr:uncharacterized protein C9374_010695 [Naegleria lovaniensis]KAG2374411.1 hypothetical protein C9374_010695 [Naegleria lovaniensis]
MHCSQPTIFNKHVRTNSSPNDGDDEHSIPSSNSSSPIVSTSLHTPVIYLNSPSQISECLESFLEPLKFEANPPTVTDSLESTLLEGFPSKDYVNSILNIDSTNTNPLFVYRNKDMTCLIDSLVNNSPSSSVLKLNDIPSSKSDTLTFQFNCASNGLNRLFQELSERKHFTKSRIEKSKKTKSTILERRKCKLSHTINADALENSRYF